MVALYVTLQVLSDQAVRLWAADLGQLNWERLLPFDPISLTTLAHMLQLGLHAGGVVMAAIIHVSLVTALAHDTLAYGILAYLGPTGRPWLARLGRRHPSTTTWLILPTNVHCSDDRFILAPRWLGASAGR